MRHTLVRLYVYNVYNVYYLVKYCNITIPTGYTMRPLMAVVSVEGGKANLNKEKIRPQFFHVSTSMHYTYILTCIIKYYTICT